MGFGLPNQEETHRREFESPPGYHWLAMTLHRVQMSLLHRVLEGGRYQ